jgi:hypothetical protein
VVFKGNFGHTGDRLQELRRRQYIRHDFPIRALHGSFGGTKCAWFLGNRCRIEAEQNHMLVADALTDLEVAIRPWHKLSLVQPRIVAVCLSMVDSAPLSPIYRRIHGRTSIRVSIDFISPEHSFQG